VRGEKVVEDLHPIAYATYGAEWFTLNYLGLGSTIY